MAIAHSHLPLLKHPVHRPQAKVWRLLVSPLQKPILVLSKLWWHTKAYSVIFAVMLLTGVSVAILWMDARLERRTRAEQRDRKMGPNWQKDL